MKAVTARTYGTPEVLEINEVPVPQVGKNEMLIRVKASSVTRADTMMRSGTPWFGRLIIGITKPKHPVTGTGFAGVVEKVGTGVKFFAKGDRVFGETTTSFGSNAEYVKVSEDGVVLPMPEGMSFEEGSVMSDGALTSMNFLRNVGEVKPGEKVLIIGASGSLGSAGVQIARQLGAHVTGVTSSRNVEFVRSLGAHDVIDYKKEDFTDRLREFDVIYDSVGVSSFVKARKALRDGGLYMSPVLTFRLLLQSMKKSYSRGLRAKFAATGMLDAATLRGLMHELLSMTAAGQVRMFIEKRFSMDQAREAHAFVETGRKRGNLVLVHA